MEIVNVIRENLPFLGNATCAWCWACPAEAAQDSGTHWDTQGSVNVAAALTSPQPAPALSTELSTTAPNCRGERQQKILNFKNQRN